MNKWLTVAVLVLLVLAGAMGLRNATTAKVAPFLVANGGGPVPPVPWMNGGGTVPPVPWNGGGPVPPVPWNR